MIYKESKDYIVQFILLCGVEVYQRLSNHRRIYKYEKEWTKRENM